MGDDAQVSEKMEYIDRQEHEADELRRQIEESLYSGAFLPLSRGRIT